MHFGRPKCIIKHFDNVNRVSRFVKTVFPHYARIVRVPRQKLSKNVSNQVAFIKFRNLDSNPPIFFVENCE